MAATSRGKTSAKSVGELEAKVSQLEAQLRAYRDAETRVKDHIKTFDELDFDVFSEQKWDKMGRSHAEDVRVIWPDGHDTRGMAKHIEDLKMMFVAMPDLSIRTHPVKFGSGDWTAVIGEMEGTFTRPMPTPDGKTIPPNGKKLRISMATIAHWNNGTIAEEYLFWDNATYMRQLGLA